MLEGSSWKPGVRLLGLLFLGLLNLHSAGLLVAEDLVVDGGVFQIVQ